MGIALPMQTTYALSLGPEAVSLRGAAASGTVLAVTRGAVYLRSAAGDVVGIVGSDGVDGPLTLRVSDLNAVRGRVTQGEPFIVESDVLTTEHLMLSLRNAERWHPDRPVFRREAHLAGGLRALASSMLDTAPDAPSYITWMAGCAVGPSLLPPDSEYSALSRRIMGALWSFGTSLSAHLYDDAAAALAKLVGLGPGLTPAGDDIAAGLLAALHWLSPPTAREVGKPALGSAPTRTNHISARMLSYGAEGLLYAPAMQLGSALLRGDTAGFSRPLKSLSRLGASTGLDIAGGILFGATLGKLLLRQG